MQNQQSISNPDNFPLDELPDLLKNTILEVARVSQSPIGLIASSMLSSMAIACQGSVNVRTPIGHILPTSLYILTIADSGERKSSTDSIFTGIIREMEQKHAESIKDALIHYQSSKFIWEVEQKNLTKSITIANKNKEDKSIYYAEVEDHYKNQPKIPKQMRILYSDVTSEALLQGLEQDWPSAALHSSEGITVISSRSLSKPGHWNELWDLDPVRTDRTEYNRLITDARLCISLMIQPGVILDYLARKNNQSFNSGFMSRFLITMPTTTQGYRSVGKMPKDLRSVGTLKDFFEKMKYWLAFSADRILSEAAYKELSFSEEAEEYYLHLLQQIEEQIKPKGSMHEHSAMASKLGNNLARISALIHSFSAEQNSDEIGIASIISAWHIAKWYSNQYIKFIRHMKKEITEDEMGNLLLSYLESRQNSNNIDFEVRDLYQLGPYSIRSKEKMMIAIRNLESRKKLHFQPHSKPMTVRLVLNRFTNN